MNFFKMYFKSVLIKPNKLYINIFINNLIENLQKIGFFRGPKVEWPLKARWNTREHYGVREREL